MGSGLRAPRYGSATCASVMRFALPLVGHQPRMPSLLAITDKGSAARPVPGGCFAWHSGTIPRRGAAPFIPVLHTSAWCAGSASSISRISWPWLRGQAARRRGPWLRWGFARRCWYRCAKRTCCSDTSLPTGWRSDHSSRRISRFWRISRRRRSLRSTMPGYWTNPPAPGRTARHLRQYGRRCGDV